MAPDGTSLGAIRAIHDFGAGDLLELALADGRTVMVPFTRAVVTEIDLARRRAVAVLPADVLEDGAKGTAA